MLRCHRLLLSAFVGVSLLFYTSEASQVKESAKVAVSLLSLIATPEAYEGKYVRVWGYAEVSEEYFILYLHNEDYRQGLTKNGLWVEVTLPRNRYREKYHKRYVLIDGIFRAKPGNWGMCSGTLEKVKMMEWKRSMDSILSP
jgi:hypothetical protein